MMVPIYLIEMVPMESNYDYYYLFAVLFLIEVPISSIHFLFASFVKLLYDRLPPDLSIDLLLLSSVSQVDYTNLHLLLLKMILLLIMSVMMHIMMTMMMKIFSML